MRLLGLQGSRTEPCNQVNIIADGDNNLLLIIVNNSGGFFFNTEPGLLFPLLPFFM